jgi:excisionase family DNA binding protein
MSTEKLLTVEKASRVLSVSKSTIYRWFWEGKLRGVKFSKNNIRILKKSVDEVFDEKSD